MRSLLAVLPALALGLSACQSQTSKAAPSAGGKSASLKAMETVAMAAHKCWFASKDPAFRGYRFANELNSMTGNPRFLLVPAKDFGGRPLLVVQAKGSSSKVDAFGPLLQEPVGSRISKDLHRWTAGDSSCGTAA